MKIRSDIKVELLNFQGSDLDIARSAWVSSATNVEAPSDKRLRGVLNSLMRGKHGSPFESGFLEFRIEAPRGVHVEHIRHRAGWSYSAESMRYSGARAEYYIPPEHRPILKGEGFKAMAPNFKEWWGSGLTYEDYYKIMEDTYQQTENQMQNLIESGFDSTEATRWISHDGTYMAWIARCNPRSLMHFLMLRTHNEDATMVSYPLWEIEQVALQMEAVLKDKFPITYDGWVKYGRSAP